MYIDVNNTRLYYEIIGKGDPLILLHGNGEDHHIFDSAVTILKDYFTCYCIDSRGHGQSMPIEKYDYQDMANDLIAFITQLNLHKVTLYGFSDGGIIGLLIASQTNLLSRLIISGANCNRHGVKITTYLEMKLSYILKHDPKIELMLNQPAITNEQLNKITIPVLVLAGSKDVIKKKHTLNLAREIANSELKILTDETHGSYIINSTKIAKIILEYIK